MVSLASDLSFLFKSTITPNRYYDAAKSIDKALEYSALYRVISFAVSVSMHRARQAVEPNTRQ